MKVIYLTTEFLGSASALKSIVENSPNHKVTAIFLSSRRGIPFLLTMLKHSGIRYAFYLILVGFFYKIVYALLQIFDWLRRKPHVTPSVMGLAKEFGIPVFKVHNINSEEALSLLRNISPDLIVSLFWDQILKREALRIPAFTSINIHNSLLPYFAGQGPTIHALSMGIKKVGVTLHRMNQNIDSGDILFNKSYLVRDTDSVLSIDAELIRAGMAALPELMDRLERNQATGIPQDGRVRKYYFHPNHATLLTFFELGYKLFTWSHYFKLCNSTYNELQLNNSSPSSK